MNDSVLEKLIMREYLLKEELKRVREEINQIREVNSRQMEMKFSVVERKK